MSFKFPRGQWVNGFMWSIYIFFRVALLTLGQSYDCPSVSEATLMNKGKISHYRTQGSTMSSNILLPNRQPDHTYNEPEKYKVKAFKKFSDFKVDLQENSDWKFCAIKFLVAQVKQAYRLAKTQQNHNKDSEQNIQSVMAYHGASAILYWVKSSVGHHLRPL